MVKPSSPLLLLSIAMLLLGAVASCESSGGAPIAARTTYSGSSAAAHADRGAALRISLSKATGFFISPTGADGSDGLTANTPWHTLLRIEYFVQMRTNMAKKYLEAIDGHPLLVPQYVPKGYVNSYWAFAAKFEGESRGIAWQDFRKQYVSNGGDGIYAAWSLLYNEPVIKEQLFYGKGCPTACPHYEGKFNVDAGQCPQAEEVQPKIMQFTTNQATPEAMDRQVNALQKTLAYFGTAASVTV